MSKRQSSTSLVRGMRVLLLLAVCSTVLMIVTPAFAQRTIECSSEGERYRYCRADTDGYVRLGRQLSDAPCIPGRSWGYDDWGIWVDNGCRAQFIIGRRGYYNVPHSRRRHDDEYDDYDRSAGPARLVECASKGGRYRYCSADTSGYVRLERQLSDTPCVKWRTWGYDHSGIWVDHGCRAQFVVGRRRGYSLDWPWQ